MNLVASLICRNELGRYLEPCIQSLLAFCDEIRVVDDASTDGSYEWLADQDRIEVRQSPTSRFYAHEGLARTALLEWTLQAEPTHVLSVDCDELVGDGRALRDVVDSHASVGAWHLPIDEVWQATPDAYMARVDGGWAQGRTLVWKVPAPARLSFPNKALACGRVPLQVRALLAKPSGVSLLHVGWLNQAERVDRHARYTKHDNGRYHARTHLASILWPAERVALEERPWPEGLEPWKEPIVERAHASAAA